MDLSGWAVGIVMFTAAMCFIGMITYAAWTDIQYEKQKRIWKHQAEQDERFLNS